MDILKNRFFFMGIVLTIIMTSGNVMAYHPINTDDPGTTEFRHFELEWGNDLIWPEDSLEEFSGYLAMKGGIAPGLEFDTVVTWIYWLDLGDDYTSGWGDAEMALKYRFFGDGEGPYNMGVAASASFPSGEEDKRIGGGENIVPTTYVFWSVGAGPVRLFMNAGASFVEEDETVTVYGGALEYPATENLVLLADVYGESDLDEGDGNDPLEGVLGFAYGAADWLTLSVGFGMGLAPDSPDYHVTTAFLVGW